MKMSRSLACPDFSIRILILNLIFFSQERRNAELRRARATRESRTTILTSAATASAMTSKFGQKKKHLFRCRPTGDSHHSSTKATHIVKQFHVVPSPPLYRMTSLVNDVKRVTSDKLKRRQIYNCHNSRLRVNRYCPALLCPALPCPALAIAIASLLLKHCSINTHKQSQLHNTEKSCGYIYISFNRARHY